MTVRKTNRRRRTTRKQIAGARLDSLSRNEMDVEEDEHVFSREFYSIITPLIRMPEHKRGSGKYISDILLSDTINNKDKYDVIMMLIVNGFNSRYFIPEKQMTILKWAIFRAHDKKTEKIALLLLDAHALPYEETDLLLSAIQKTNIDLLPQKLIDTGYRPNTSELSQLGYHLKFNFISMGPTNKGWLVNYFKARRQQGVSTLRHRKSLDRKRLTGVDAPKTAFVIMGHGGELNQKRTQMPVNCVLAAQAHSGETSYSSDGAFFALFNYDRKTQILDPITNYASILDAILKGRGPSRSNYSSLAVYRTGDLFPEFIYQLLAFWDSDREEGGTPNMYKIIDSGVAQYPFNGGAPQTYRLNKSSTDYEPLINVFKRSIYPTSTQIRTFIEAIPNPKTIETIVNKLLESPLITITQSQLFAKLGSGVYYNLVCRDIVSTNETRWLAISEEARQFVGLTKKFRTKYPEILSAIEEAEVERKDLIEYLHLNDDGNFDIPDVDSLLIEIDRKITSGDTNPRIPYLKYLYSKKYYQRLLDYYTNKLIAAEEASNLATHNFFHNRLVDLQRTVATPQHLSESDLQSVMHYPPPREIKAEEISQQQKQKAAHNQWVASHPNNNSVVQRPEDFEARARLAMQEAERKVRNWNDPF